MSREKFGRNLLSTGFRVSPLELEVNKGAGNGGEGAVPNCYRRAWWLLEFRPLLHPCSQADTGVLNRSNELTLVFDVSVFLVRRELGVLAAPSPRLDDRSI